MILKSGWNRRSFLSALGALGGSLFTPAEIRAASKRAKLGSPSVDGNPIVPITSGLGSTGDIYAELGVKPLININGTITVIGGSVMRPEVMELMRPGAAAVVHRGKPQDVAMIQYTSGSTGSPKGVVLTHANLLVNIRAMGKAY